MEALKDQVCGNYRIVYRLKNDAVEIAARGNEPGIYISPVSGLRYEIQQQLRANAI